MSPGEAPDLGEAVEFILGERPRLAEDDVWAVLVTLQEIPAPGSEALAAELVRSAHPSVTPRQVRLIIGEWRAYAALASEPDWDDDLG